MEDTLTIIPAKSKSRRLPGKNIACLDGKPLIVHAIEQAQASSVCGEICVGTDDSQIADIARAAGAAVPFLRHDDSDDITSVGVAALNIVRRYSEELNRRFRHICLLLTTSPLRRPEDIVGCRELLLQDVFLDASMSIVYSEKHPAWAWQFKDACRIIPMFPAQCQFDRHELPKPYYIDGAVYWAKMDFFMRSGGNQYAGNVAGYVMQPEHAIDVDTPLDLSFCEFLLSAQTGNTLCKK